jgi:surface carbohydrate biosynthesis protein
LADRVALIVNNPVRDLASMVLLAYGLCQQGVKCFLVPLSIRSQELWALAPDLVLLPSFQPLFTRWIEPLHQAGMVIGLHDGEGSPATGIDKYAASCIQDPRLRSMVDFVSTWGSEMLEHIRQQNVYPKARVLETGTMRYDFYVEPWRRAIMETTPGLDRYAQPMVMINTHYPRGNPGPGFGSFEQIYKLLLERGYTPAGAQEYLDQSKTAFQEMAGLANYLAERFPQATFIFRPHPFELLDTYRQLLKDLPNLRLVREGLVYGWLLRSVAVIHTGCLTGVEGAFVGIPGLMPSWFAQALGNEESKAVAEPFASPEALGDALAAVLAGTYRRPERVEQVLKDFIARRFHAIDGLAWQRHVQIIMEELDRPGAGAGREFCRDFLYGLQEPATAGGYLLARLKKAWGMPPQWSLRQKKVVLDPVPERKLFDLEDARSMAEAIAACDAERNQGLRMSLRPASYVEGDYICPYWGKSSVLELQGKEQNVEGDGKSC